MLHWVEHEKSYNLKASDATECSVWSESRLFATHPGVFKEASIDSKKDLFKYKASTTKGYGIWILRVNLVTNHVWLTLIISNLKWPELLVWDDRSLK